MNRQAVVEDLLRVNYLMRKPLTRNECERVLAALALANYDVVRLPPMEGVQQRRKR